METKKQLTEEQIEKLQKYNDYLKKRNSLLSRSNVGHERTIQELRREFRAENRVNDKLKDILFSVSRGQTNYYSLGTFINWVREIAQDNENLRDKVEEFKIMEKARLLGFTIRHSEN